MKKWLLVFLFLLFSYPAMAANPSGCGFYDVGCVASQFGVNNYGNWLPPKGRILYFGDEKRFQIDLYFDQDTVDFYQANPWAGFEIDIIPRTGILSIIQANSVWSDNSNSEPMRDTIVGDWNSGTRGITVTNPSAITEGWVSFSFTLKGSPLIGTTIKANIQLVANALDSTFVDSLWNNNSWWWFGHQYWEKWFPVAMSGNMFAYVMPGGGEKVFSFFSMANAWQALEVGDGKPLFEVNSNIVGEGMYWEGRENVNSFAKKCNLYDSQTTLNIPTLLPSVYDVNVNFVQKLMQDALDQLSGDNESIVQIFTIGNHTHIVHNDYRCSKEIGGPILCWESGTDPNEPDGKRNCWNAWEWYKFNGDVSQVADHHNDSGWITNLSRDYTCNEVYNSGGSSGGGNSGGSGGGSGGLPPVSGDKVDLTPDFDIYNEQGQEISSNNSNDLIQTVQVGQRIKFNLTTEVHNDDVDNHLRDNDSNSIEGPVYYWIDGVIR